MKKSPECVELQSCMLEYFSNPDDLLLKEIDKHLLKCAICKKEFEELKHTLTELEKSAADCSENVPDGLLASIEDRLDSVEQVHRSEQSEIRVRSALMLQYSYLTLMSVIIWLTLLFAQPFLSEWLSHRSLLTAVPLIDEYGLFMVFFVIGGLFALLSSPILIRTALKQGSAEKSEKFFTRFFSTGIRFFAC